MKMAAHLDLSSFSIIRSGLVAHYIRQARAFVHSLAQLRFIVFHPFFELTRRHNSYRPCRNSLNPVVRTAVGYERYIWSTRHRGGWMA
jgi:hypothetical protein